MNGKVYLSELAHPRLQEYLKSKGYEIQLVKQTDAVYPEVSSHADLYMCKLGAEPEAPVFHVEDISELGYRYPANVKYNGVCMGKYFIHNTEHTSSRLMGELEAKGLIPIKVKQGYTKCNMVVVNDHAAITSDVGLYNSIQAYKKKSISEGTADEHNFPEILLIRQGYVDLPGFSYGFLGGASGRVGDEIVFNGNLESHPDFRKIQLFIEAQGLKVKYFPEYPLTDIGSIIEERRL